MGSTGEHDRKRRHFSSDMSPTAAAAAAAAAAAPKKQPSFFFSEQKTLDAAVLQFQNHKLLQKLEAQKVEYDALQEKFAKMKLAQQPFDPALKVINKNWETLLADLKSRTSRAKELSREKSKQLQIVDDGSSSCPEDVFMSRIMQTGATETCSNDNCPNQMEEDGNTATENTKAILYNLADVNQQLWCLKNKLLGAVSKKHDDGSCKLKASSDLASEVMNLRSLASDLILKHRSLARELLTQQDLDAKTKAELKRLQGELGSTAAELEESNCELASLKAEKDATKGAFFPVLNLVGKHVSGDRVRDKQKDLQDMESTLKTLADEASSRLIEIKNLHEEQIKLWPQLSHLQNTVKNLQQISSSQAYLSLRDRLEKTKAEVAQYQALFEKLQVERDNLAWRERELSIKSDFADVSRRNLSVIENRIGDLEKDIQKQVHEKKRIESKLEEASREPGRKQVIAEFKALVSSFPDEMSAMQSQLTKYKEAAVDIHTVRADVPSLSSVLNWKTKECKTLSTTSANQAAEIYELQAKVDYLNITEDELKLFWDAYKRESIDSREVMEAKDQDYRAWAEVESLKSSLDEQSLELRVKTAIEAEAISQQQLATAEAEIADLRQMLEVSKREKDGLSDVLKSKNEENEAYLTEIETIGQAYDDMQAQNQQLLQQVTERDDYNIKLVLETTKAKQLQDSLHMNKRSVDRQIQQANDSLNFYGMKTARIEDQLKLWSEQVHKLKEERFQRSATLENTQKRLLEARRNSQQAREVLEATQTVIDKNRSAHLELQLELEKERFDRKRADEELEIVRGKVSRLHAQIEGSSVLEKLKQELREYSEVLKCSICLDRRKEVVIAKCYHLFCNPCVQKLCETRQRRCPVCSASFGPNDVKPVYI